MRNLLFKLRFVIFIKMIIALKFCNSAGGRGGAIATKGKTSKLRFDILYYKLWSYL